MRKTFLAFVVFFLLTGCSSTPTPEPISALTIVTPVVGGVTVLSVQGKTVLPLRSQPDSAASATGEVKAGDLGKLLGVDASGLWMLVEIKHQTGWLPTQYLDYTIAQ